jgi:hypothetical protein
MVKIMVNHLVISSSTGKLPLRWGPVLSTIFAFFDALSFQFGEGSMSLDCVAHDADDKSSIWLVTSIAAALTPIVLVSLCAFTLLPTRSLWRKKLYLDSVVIFKVSVMVIMLLSHPTLTRLSIGLFACRDIRPTVDALGVRIKQADQDQYTTINVLEKDFGQACTSEHMYAVRFSLGVPMILFYVIGVPVYYFWRLFRNRDQLDRVRFKYSFLLSGFREERYYWEVYNTVRKAVFTMVTVLLLPIGPRMQIWGTMLVLQMFYGMETWGHPHVNPILNGIEDLALSLDVLQLFCGLGLFFSTDEGLLGTATFLSITILVTNIAFIVYWVAMWWKHSDYRKKATKSIKGLSVRAAKNASKLLRQTKHRGKADSFFGVDDASLKQVLELKRMKNQQREAERRQMRDQKRGSRRRKTLRDDDLDKDAASVAAAKMKGQLNLSSVKDKIRRASGGKIKSASAFLQNARPERVPSAVMDLQKFEAVQVTVKEEEGMNTKKKNSRRSRKSRGSCFIPRPGQEGNGDGDADADENLWDIFDDEEHIDPMQKEIDDAEDKLLALLEKRIRLLEADTVKRRAGKLAAGREANIGYMGGETMRGDEGRGGGGGGASMWGKLRSVVSVTTRTPPWVSNKVQKLDINLNRMPSPATSPKITKQAGRALTKGKARLGRGASSQRKRRPSSREVIRAAEENKKLKEKDATLSEGVELMDVQQASHLGGSDQLTTATRRPTLGELAAAMNHSSIVQQHTEGASPPPRNSPGGGKVASM